MNCAFTILLKVGILCFRLQGSPSVRVTVRNIAVPPFHHSVQVEMKVYFWHCTQCFFEATQPHKRLFARHRIEVWVGFSQWSCTVLLASWVCVVFQVKIIDQLVYIQPDVLEFSRKGQGLLCHFQIVQVTHVVIAENNFLPVFPSQVPECCHQPNKDKKEDLSWSL